MCHYSDYYERDAYDNLQKQNEVGVENHDLKLKDTYGKPQGARHCFIESLHYIGISNLYTKTIGRFLVTLFTAFENKKGSNTILDIINQTTDYILENSTKKDTIINEFIQVRAHALESGKYKKAGYKEKIDPMLLCDAAARHYIKFILKNERDAESGYLHLSHLIANLLIIGYQVDTYGVMDYE